MPESFGHGLFVTGTGTGVGKTVVSAVLLARLRDARPTRYWKPIQTGIEDDDDSTAVRLLSGASPREIFNAGVRLPRPLSPHLAARLAGRHIALDELVTLGSARPHAEFWIVEGAGGVLVPINDRELMIDLIAALGLPSLVVARSELGTINHTLLTIEALRARSLAIAGVVMNGDPNPANREAIERYGRVAVLGALPRLETLNRESLQSASADWELTPLMQPGAVASSSSL